MFLERMYRSWTACVDSVRRVICHREWQGWALLWLCRRAAAAGWSTVEAAGGYLAAKWGTNRRSADRFLAKLERLGIVEITYRGGRHFGVNNPRRVAVSRAALKRIAMASHEGQICPLAVGGAHGNNADEQGDSKPKQVTGCAQLDHYPEAWVVPSWVREDPLWGRDDVELPEPPDAGPPVGEVVLGAIVDAFGVLVRGPVALLRAGGAL